MKKIITVFITLLLSLSLFALPSFAEEATEAPTDETAIETPVTEDTAGTDETPNITVENEEKAFREELVAALTDGGNWAKFGGILASVLAVLGVLYKYTSGINTMIGGVKSLVEGKATRAETEATVKAEGEKILSATLAALEDTRKRQDELNEKYNEQTAILTLITLQLVKSPYARTEIMNIISTAKAKGKDVSEIVEVIEAEIKAAEAAEVKASTPALDKIVASVTDTDTDGDAEGVALG